MTAHEWEICVKEKLASLHRPAAMVEFLKVTNRWRTVHRRKLNECVRKGLLKNFGTKDRPLYALGNVLTMMSRLTDDSIERRANGSFRINMEHMQHGRAA